MWKLSKRNPRSRGRTSGPGSPLWLWGIIVSLGLLFLIASDRIETLRLASVLLVLFYFSESVFPVSHLSVFQDLVEHL